MMGVPRWLQAIELLAPTLASVFIPGPAGQILGGVIAHGIQDAEHLTGASGSEKLQHVVNLTNDAVAGINAVRPNTLDPVLVQSTAVTIINGVVQTANLVKNTPVHTSEPTQTQAPTQ
jgi:hypothetical protein